MPTSATAAGRRRRQPQKGREGTMKNAYIERTEAAQIEAGKTYTTREKDKEGKEVEKVVAREIDDFSVGDNVEIYQRILEAAR